MSKQDSLKRGRITSTLLALLVVAASSPAQVGIQQGTDLSGSWAALNQEDTLERLRGVYAVDYTGMPLNEEGRAKALSWLSPETMIERQCLFWPPQYIALSVFPLRIWAENHPETGRTIAWHIGAWSDRGEMTIWMDGRPHPSANARHPTGGFTTGVWQGNDLIATTTHVKAGIFRRNGVPSSDEETSTTHFVRHRDLLTVVTIMRDPVYLTEPYIASTSFRLSVDGPPLPPMGPVCITTYEGDSGNGRVPHILPGQNPSINEMTDLYGIPRDAVLGGAETMYPEFRDKIKDKFKLPEKCTRNCSPAPAQQPAVAEPGR